MGHQQRISVVIPAFNEENNIPVISNRLKEVLTNWDLEIIFVDDGSIDSSLKQIQALHREDPRIHYLSFSRNFGHQASLRAGIEHATGEAVITMDADLQHPPELIPQLIAKWQEGYEIVSTLRQEDKKLSWAKRHTSRWFYKVLQKLSNLQIEEGQADFRLLDRKVVETIRKFQESDLFLRGLVSWMGFRQLSIPYHPAARFSGQTKYSFKKMLKLAISGITSFSIKPLHLATLLGMLVSMCSAFYALYAILIYFMHQRVISGWASVLVSSLFMGGVQLIMLGVLGEYLGRLFIQAKGRPNYLVRETSLKK